MEAGKAARFLIQPPETMGAWLAKDAPRAAAAEAAFRSHSL
jgi:hypothetical protein